MGGEIDSGGAAPRQTMQLRHRFVGGATWLLAGAAASRLLSLAGTIVATRILLPRDFGRLSYTQAAVGLGAGVAMLGLNIAVTKTVAVARSRSSSEAALVIWLSLRIAVVSGGVLALAMFLFRNQVAGLLGSPELTGQLAQASLAVAAGAIFLVAVGALNGMESFRAVAVVTSVRSVLSSALMVLGAAFSGLTGAIVGWVIGESISAIAAVLALVRRQQVKPVRRHASWRSGSPWRTLRAIALPAFFANVAVTLALVVGQRILADQPFGYEHVAQFNVAYRWSLAVLFIPASIAPILLPLLANLRAEGSVTAFKRLLRTNLALSVIITALPAGLLVVFREQILGLSGSAYLAESATFVVLMIATVPTALNSAMSQAALSLDATRAWLLSDVVLAVVLIGVATALIPRSQSLGLAVGYAFAYLATCVVLAGPLWRRMHRLHAATDAADVGIHG
jgi:O-antigen/teichoic acid export membrane protein